MNNSNRFLNGWISSLLGVIVIGSCIGVLAVHSAFHLVIQLVILGGGFSVGAWLLGMDDELIKGFLNLHKFDSDDDEE